MLGVSRYLATEIYKQFWCMTFKGQSLIPGNYQSDFQSEIVADIITDFKNYHNDLLIAFNDEDELQEVVEDMVEEYSLSVW